jgi:hypothetical protein
MPSLPALVAGVLAVLLHPSGDARVVLGLCAYVAAGFLIPSPLLRCLLPIAGTAGFDAFCTAAFATRFNNELGFAPFLLASTAWAALLCAGPSAAPRRVALACGLSAAAAACAFAFMAIIDRAVALYAPFSRPNAFPDPLHLMQIVMAALAFFLLVWLAAPGLRRRRRDKLVAYAEACAACRRELDTLARRFPW